MTFSRTGGRFTLPGWQGGPGTAANADGLLACSSGEGAGDCRVWRCEVQSELKTGGFCAKQATATKFCFINLSLCNK